MVSSLMVSHVGTERNREVPSTIYLERYHRWEPAQALLFPFVGNGSCPLLFVGGQTSASHYMCIHALVLALAGCS